MAESLERIQQLLLEAKKATEDARIALDGTESQLRKIDGIHLDIGTSLPSAGKVLSDIEANVDAMKARRGQMAELIAKVENVRNGIGDVYAIEAEFEAYLERIQKLDARGDYQTAIEVCDALLELSRSKDFGKPLNIQALIEAIVPWTRVALYLHLGEHNIESGYPPFHMDGLDMLQAQIDELPIGIHTEEQRDLYADRVRGFRCVTRVYEIMEEGYTYDYFIKSLELLLSVRDFEESFTPLTRDRASYLYSAIIDEYNALCADAFDKKDVYEDALKLFNLRGYFMAERIAHPAYRDSIDEHEFKIRFFQGMLSRASYEVFEKTVRGYGEAVVEPKGFEFDVIATLFATPGLSEEKVTVLCAVMSTFDFQTAIELTAKALSLNPEQPRQAAMLENLRIRKAKDRRLDLDASSKALLYCRDSFAESLQKPFGILLKDLLRSPHAHKVCVKSNVPETHMLYGEPREDYRKPIGKPVKNPVAKSWDFSLKGCYVWFGIIFPIVVLAFAFAFLYFLFGEQEWGKYVLIAPLVALTVFLHFIVTARFGRDERGSGVYRKMLGLTALVQATLGLLYVAIPGTFGFLAPVGYTLIGAAAFEGLWGALFYKDNKKALTALVYIPLLLVEIASAVLIILQAVGAY